MAALEMASVEVDHCLRCKGVWLDEGEMELLLEGEAPARAFLAEFKSSPAQIGPKRACPACHKSMAKVHYGAPRVEVDECRKHGIWFDKGELTRVLQAAGAGRSHPVFAHLGKIFHS